MSSKEYHPELNKITRIQSYQEDYLKDYDFEKIMVWARQKYIAGLIEEIKPAVVIEVGCGKDLLFETVRELAGIKKWVIVEPSEIFAN